MTITEAKTVVDTLLDINSLNLSNRFKAKLTRALNILKDNSKDTVNGFWIYTEHTEYFDGGGSIVVRGYECSNCRGFTRKKTGIKDYCSFCGSKNKILEEV